MKKTRHSYITVHAAVETTDAEDQEGFERSADHAAIAAHAVPHATNPVLQKTHQ